MSTSEYNKAYYVRNKEKIVERRKKTQKAYYEANKEKFYKRHKAWKAKNKGKMKEYNKKWLRKKIKENPDYARNATLKRLYGITLSDYAEMLVSQNGECKLCGVSHEEKRLAVDHDHKTKRVRGLLCNKCNLALGALGDDIDGIMRAASYLEEHS